MKKNGFTLIEILITLTVIGIVAAISIPTLVTNNKKKVWSNSLAVAVSNMENAMTSYLVTENEYSLADTKAWKEYPNNLDNKENALGKKISLKKISSSASSYYSGKKVYPINPKSNALSNISSVGINGVAYETKNGIAYFIEVVEGEKKDLMTKGGKLERRVANIGIDVTGKKGPNRIGRDIFLFALGEDGYLFPYGSEDLNLYDGTSLAKDSNCSSNTNSNGLHCSARLVQNGYNMDY